MGCVTSDRNQKIPVAAIATRPSAAESHGAILREVLSQTAKEKSEAYPSMHARYHYKNDIAACTEALVRQMDGDRIAMDIMNDKTVPLHDRVVMCEYM